MLRTQLKNMEKEYFFLQGRGQSFGALKRMEQRVELMEKNLDKFSNQVAGLISEIFETPNNIKDVKTFFTQMSDAYGKCEVAAREAGMERLEEMYREKSLEAAAAISKIYEREQIQAKAALKEEMEMMKMMEGMGMKEEMEMMERMGMMGMMNGMF